MKRIMVYSGLAAALFVALSAMELVKGDEPATASEIALDLFEKALLALAMVATAYTAQEVREARIERAGLFDDLARARADGDRWRETVRVHIDGLGRAIRGQFDAWRLTAGESDVAILMLKGLSHKEIARLRNTSSATVRQQAAAIYGKSGLTSRAELAAFFLEDIFASETGNGGTAGRALPHVVDKI